MVAERAAEDVPARRRAASWSATSASTASAKVASVVTRMAGESGPCSAWVMRSAATRPGSAGGVGEDHPLRRAGREVDADLAADLDLGGGDPGIARPDDPVDRREARVGQPERERADRLGAAGDDEGVDLEQPGRAEQDRVRPAIAGRRATRRRPDPRPRPVPARRS